MTVLDWMIPCQRTLQRRHAGYSTTKYLIWFWFEIVWGKDKFLMQLYTIGATFWNVMIVYGSVLEWGTSTDCLGCPKVAAWSAGPWPLFIPLSPILCDHAWRGRCWCCDIGCWRIWQPPLYHHKFAEVILVYWFHATEQYSRLERTRVLFTR